MNRQRYPTSAAGPRPRARAFHAAILLPTRTVVASTWLGHRLQTLIGLFGLVTACSLVAQPAITTHPQSTSVSLGATAVFRVAATTTSPPLTYQWQLAGTNLPGATSSVLTLQNVTLEQEGIYTAVVSDAVGSRTSNPATLDVDPTFVKITKADVVQGSLDMWVPYWVDLDGDGWLELVVAGGYWTTGGKPLMVYQNNHDGTLSRTLTHPLSNVSGRFGAIAWADLDSDGDLDAFAGQWEGQTPLYLRNNGGGQWTTTIANGTWTANGMPTAGSCATAADFENDGTLDLLVGSWGNAATGVWGTNTVLHGLGEGRFEVDLTSPLALSHTWPEQFSWADWDSDGLLDLFAATSWDASQVDLMFQNLGGGQFIKVTNSPLVTVPHFSIAALWGDYDNDGDLDVCVASQSVANQLYRNLGNGVFEVDPGSTIRDGGGVAAWGDYDNDGWLDLFIPVGPPSRLFHNRRDGTFEQITTGSPVTESAGYGSAWGDYDNDGFLDLWVVNGGPGVNYLYRNNLRNVGNTNGWLKVKLVGSASNRDGIGATIRVKATISGTEVWQMRQMVCQSCESALLAHFGLGDAAIVETLRIEWPSGRVTELSNLAVNQFLVVPEQGVGLSPRTVVTAPTSNVTLRATVVGLISPAFQWKLNGANLPGAVSDTLVLSNIQVSDAGTYTVEATDDTGTYLSNPSEVTVYDKPVITQQPQSLTVTNGSAATFTVSAVSATPIRYQWRFNRATMADRTNATLNLTNVQAEHGGEYDVVVSDDHGSTNSDPAQLTVLLKPRITLCATNYTVVQGGNLTLSVEADGEQPIAYIWRRISTVKDRQTNYSHRSFLTLTNVQPTEDRANNVYYLVNLLNSVLGGTGVQSDRIYLTVLSDTDGDGMDDDWEANYPTCTEPDGDADDDGRTNYQEYQAGTDPTDPQRYLKVERIAVNGEARIEFIAAANQTYTVEYTESLDNIFWHKLTDVVAGPDNRTVVLTDPAGASQRFYRLITPQQP